ncbi:MULTISPECIES: hypothetical protein [unclassified Mycobacterium]|nr:MULTISPECIES: hypothetical protein [unclassified Mycobacterium]
MTADDVNAVAVGRAVDLDGRRPLTHSLVSHRWDSRACASGTHTTQR